MREAIEAGAARVVLGTAAYRDVDFLDEAVAEYGDRVVVSVDARGRHAGRRGLDRADRDPGRGGDRAARRAAACARFVYSSIDRDGMLAGPDLDGVRRVADGGARARSSTPAGSSSLEDLRALVELRQVNLTGVIVGKALYEGRFTRRPRRRPCWTAS